MPEIFSRQLRPLTSRLVSRDREVSSLIVWDALFGAKSRGTYNSNVRILGKQSARLHAPIGLPLFVSRKPRVRLAAQIHGGGHERGMRSGTLATHQIVGMGEAFRLARLQMAEDNAHIRDLRDRLLRGLEPTGQSFRNCDATQVVPHIVNLSFNFVEGESLIMAIEDLAV
jgi:cysteine desulfurase